jgi:hypothetical protein
MRNPVDIVKNVFELMMPMVLGVVDIARPPPIGGVVHFNPIHGVKVVDDYGFAHRNTRKSQPRDRVNY